jgi:hypothetical protein
VLVEQLRQRQASEQLVLVLAVAVQKQRGQPKVLDPD